MDGTDSENYFAWFENIIWSFQSLQTFVFTEFNIFKLCCTIVRKKWKPLQFNIFVAFVFSDFGSASGKLKWTGFRITIFWQEAW